MTRLRHAGLSLWDLKASTCLAVVCFFVMAVTGCRRQVNPDVSPARFTPVIGYLKGAPLQGRLDVTVVDAVSAASLKDAVVYLHKGQPLEEIAHRTTDKNGHVVFENVIGPVTVTTVCEAREAYDTITFMGIDASDLLVPMTLRKTPDRVAVTMELQNLDHRDSQVMVFHNDHLYSPIAASGFRPGTPFLLRKTVFRIPTGFTVFSGKKDSGIPSKFGWTVLADGPLSSGTPINVSLKSIPEEEIRTVSGLVNVSADNHLNAGVAKKNIREAIRIDVLVDAGRAGYLTAGMVRMDDGLNFQAACFRIPGLDQTVIRARFHDGAGEDGVLMETYLRKPFGQLPEQYNFSFMKPPDQLESVSIPDRCFPVLTWRQTAGNVSLITVEQPDFDYNWRIYLMNESGEGRLEIPPLEPGSAGALIPGETYYFQVQTMDVPGLNPRSFSFQDIRRMMRRMSLSRRNRFVLQCDEIE